jgi:hypothetical protein
VVVSAGPCLCGDPYCPSCGDPSLARWEDAIDSLVTLLETELGVTEDEFAFLMEVIPVLVTEVRSVAKKAVEDAREPPENW